MGLFSSSGKTRRAKAQEDALDSLRAAMEVEDDLDGVMKALAAAKEACANNDTGSPLLTEAAELVQKILDARLAASQANSAAEACEVLNKLMAASLADDAGPLSLEALESALPEADEAGVPQRLLAQAVATLKTARARQSEKKLRAAITSRSERTLYQELTSARKATPRRPFSTSRSSSRSGGGGGGTIGGGGAVAIDSALLDEAEQVLQSIRRQDAAAQRLRRVVEMSGPAALAKAVEVARGDPHMPAKELARAERALARRQREQKLMRWLHVLQEAHRAQVMQAQRERQAVQRDGWQAELQSGGELSAVSEAELKQQVGVLHQEVHKRLGNPFAKPPAWLYLVTEALERFPSPALSAPQLARAKASARQAANSQISRTVLRALMEMIRTYHPDKNQAYGEAWSAIAEELTKLGVHLYSEYQTRIDLGA